MISSLMLQSPPLAGPKFHLRMYCLVSIVAGGVICMNVAECVECSECDRLFLCYEMKHYESDGASQVTSP